MQFLSKITQNRNIKNNPEQCGFYLKATSAYFCFFCIDTIPNTEKLSWTEVLTEKLKNSAIKKYCKSQMLDNQEKEINKGQKFCTGRIVIIAITTRSSMSVNLRHWTVDFWAGISFIRSPWICSVLTLANKNPDNIALFEGFFKF